MAEYRAEEDACQPTNQAGQLHLESIGGTGMKCPCKADWMPHAIACLPIDRPLACAYLVRMTAWGEGACFTARSSCTTSTSC